MRRLRLRNEESLIEAMIVKALSAKGAFVFKVPNDALWARRVPGAVKGAPDLVVVAPTGVVGFIEVKTSRGGLSPAQKEVHTQLVKRNALHAVCRSVEDAVRFYERLCELRITEKKQTQTERI